jgi:WD40 repeat protein
LRSGTGEVLRRWSMVPDYFSASALALRDDGTLATLSLFEVVVWDAAGRKVAELRSDSEQFGHAEYEALAWSPDGAQLALATKAPEVLLWRTDRPAPDRSVSLARKLEKHLDRIEVLAWSGDGSRLAIGSTSGRLFEYDVAGLRPLARWAVDPLHGLRYSPDGERLVIVDISGQTLTVPSPRDPAALLAALWRTNRSCPSPAERERWLNLDAEAAVRDHARCEKILACVAGGAAAASCVR